MIFLKMKKLIFSPKEQAVFWEREAYWHFDYNAIF